MASGQAVSEALKFDHLTIEEGLSHNSVNALLQDKYGYIWIGTQNGLNRYDSYKCKNFGLDLSNKDLQGKKITALFEDSVGSIWVGTEKHGAFIKPNDENIFQPINIDSSFSVLQNSTINSIYEDNEQNIWIASLGQGLFRYNLTSKTTKLYNHLNSNLSSDLVFDVIVDDEKRVWVAAAGDGINLLDKQGRFSLMGTEALGQMNGFRKVMLLDEDILWLGTDRTGLYSYGLSNEQIEKFDLENGTLKLSHNAVRALAKLPGDRLFVGTDGGGINILDLANAKVETYKSELGNPMALNSNAIFKVLKDFDDNLWIGTFNGGVNIVKKSKIYFDVLNKTNSNLENQSILSVSQSPSGDIFLCTDGGGLYELNHSNLKEIKKHHINVPGNQNSLAGNVVKSVLQASDGKIWVGMFSSGLDIYNPRSQQYKHFNAQVNNNILGSYNIWSIIERRNGEIWLSTLGNGIYITDKSSTEFQSIIKHDNDPKSLSDMSVFTLYEDSKGVVWAGTAENGLDRWNDQTQSFDHFKNDPDNPNSLSSNDVRSIYEDKQNRLWVGTESGGLNIWDGSMGFKRIQYEDGLLANNIMAIVEDDQGFIWVTSYNGVSVINPDNYEIENFDFHASGRNNQFNQGAILKDNNDLLYFGGINGLNTIHSSSLKKEKDIANKPVFTSLKIFNSEIGVDQDVISEPIESAKDIYLNYNDKSFTIDFSAFDFSNALEKTFQYQLEGFDTEWRITNKGENSASYTNLDPKSYVFRIKYGNEVNEINIHVKPPFWSSWWFTLILVLTTLGILLFAARSYLGKRDDQFQKQLLLKEREILELKNKNLEEDVVMTNSKLLSSTAQMARKNEFLTDIKSDLQNQIKEQKQDARSIIRKIERELESEDYWSAFNMYFNKVDKDFVKSIIAKHPELTQNDIRLCSLIRINLSTKEIASMLNISVRGAEKSRYRLKKRLNLSTEESLSKYIRAFKNDLYKA